MTSLTVRPLQDDLPFGVRVAGVTYETLEDPAVRRQLVDLFEDRGLIVFEDIEPSQKMHVTLSNVFGPLKDHPVPVVDRVDQDAYPGVIDMKHDPDKANVVEIGGKKLASWLPWHFDHCYNNELNRAGVLRAIDIAPEGGMTAFADGIELYQAISPELRDGIEGKNILYSLDLSYHRMRFGKPESFKVIREDPAVQKVVDQAATQPRSVHPAVWTRDDGAKVMHVSPWMSWGIEGEENPQGDALFEAVCQEVVAKVHAYYHQWKPSEMLIWDNWRMLHAVTGCDPTYHRRMQRTTIKGDYGLGYFEGGAKGGDKVLEMTV